MSQASVFVYLAFPEGFGLPPLEAMAQGAVVVTTDTCGGRDYLRHAENCLVVPNGDGIAAWAYARAAAQNPDLATTLRAAATETAKHYTREIFDARWRPVLSKVVSGSWQQDDPVTWNV